MADDVAPAARTIQDVYQLRAVIGGISPLIWRRLLVPAQTTIAQLHAIVQTVFGWSGEYLHRFCIHGTEYGTYQVSGPLVPGQRPHGVPGRAGPAHPGEIQLRV
jgi:hypothetical protein